MVKEFEINDILDAVNSIYKTRKKGSFSIIHIYDDLKETIYKVKTDWVKKSSINKSEYEKKYIQSLKDN